MKESKNIEREIARLILANQHKDATPEQREALRKWIAESDENRHFYEQLTDKCYSEQSFQEFISFDSSGAWKKVREKLAKKPKTIYRRLWPYVAAIVLIFGVAGIWRYSYHLPSPSETQIGHEEILSGSSKACLIIHEGKSINLVKGENEMVENIEGEHFVNDGNTIDYSSSPDRAGKVHTLQVPRGGEYQLILSDGTRVWLNAESEISYPTHFNGAERRVELTGEAYFEVAKDASRPFYVKAGGMEVKVLGTFFNVHAYPNEIVRTTLIEGQVEVGYNGGRQKIRPGEQVAISAGNLSVSQVNVNNYMGWRERRIICVDKLLPEVFRDLERWYDIEVLIADEEVRNIYLTANLPRYENMDKIIEIIEYAACVKIARKGRSLTVTSEN